jgi:hypothetical protein
VGTARPYMQLPPRPYSACPPPPHPLTPPYLKFTPPPPQAALLSAEAGMEGLFFGRIDYQDLALRRAERRAEWVWRASPSLGPDAQVGHVNMGRG